jgi:hypothetical protein
MYERYIKQKPWKTLGESKNFVAEAAAVVVSQMVLSPGLNIVKHKPENNTQHNVHYNSCCS